MDVMPVAMFISRDPECRNIIGNRSAYRLVREQPGNNLSKSTTEGQPPAFRAIQDGKAIPSHELPLQKAIATGQSVNDLELELVFQDGTRANALFRSRQPVRFARLHRCCKPAVAGSA